MSGGSENDPWGWFEDVETDAHGSGHGGGDPSMTGQGNVLLPTQFVYKIIMQNHCCKLLLNCALSISGSVQG